MHRLSIAVSLYREITSSYLTRKQLKTTTLKHWVNLTNLSVLKANYLPVQSQIFFLNSFLKKTLNLKKLTIAAEDYVTGSFDGKIIKNSRCQAALPILDGPLGLLKYFLQVSFSLLRIPLNWTGIGCRNSNDNDDWRDGNGIIFTLTISGDN